MATKHTINALESGIVEGVGVAPFAVAVGGSGAMRSRGESRSADHMTEFEYTLILFRR